MDFEGDAETLKDASTALWPRGKAQRDFLCLTGRAKAATTSRVGVSFVVPGNSRSHSWDFCCFYPPALSPSSHHRATKTDSGGQKATWVSCTVPGHSLSHHSSRYSQILLHDPQRDTLVTCRHHSQAEGDWAEHTDPSHPSSPVWPSPIQYSRAFLSSAEPIRALSNAA